MTPLAYYGHHAGSAAGWLADIAMRGIIYSTINRVMRSLTITEALLIAGGAVCAFLVFRRH